jgi:hypothetical protein
MMELGRRARMDSPRSAQRVRRKARIGPVIVSIAGELTADGARRSPEGTGYGPDAGTRLTQARNRHALLRLKLAVCRTDLHECTLPEGGCCTSDLRLPPQWGYAFSIYCPKSKCWVLVKRKECRIVEKLKALNQELQSEWFYFKDGFMDYWKGF